MISKFKMAAGGLILAMLGAGYALASDGPTISVGSLRIFSNATAPIASGDAGLWRNGNTLNFRKTTGADVDLTSTLPSQTGNSGKFLRTNGTVASWVTPTLDEIAAAFAVSSFSGTGITTKELGDTIVSPAFTISYNRTASAAVISDNIPNTSLTLTTPFTSGTMAYTYSKSTPNASVTWTVTADEGGPSKTSTTSASWRTRTYYGIATPATVNQAFVTGLPSSGLASGAAGSFSIGAGNNTKKAYYCLDSAFSPSTFKDGSGFTVPMSLDTTLSITNSFSVVRAFNCYSSDQLLNAAFTLVVT